MILAKTNNCIHFIAIICQLVFIVSQLTFLDCAEHNNDYNSLLRHYRSVNWTDQYIKIYNFFLWCTNIQCIKINNNKINLVGQIF